MTPVTRKLLSYYVQFPLLLRLLLSWRECGLDRCSLLVRGGVLESRGYYLDEMLCCALHRTGSITLLMASRIRELYSGARIILHMTHNLCFWWHVP
jgi:hypothetical protein